MAPPNPNVVKAFKAMKQMDIPEQVVKPVLKNLLKLYDKNWKLIEDDNYAVLLDAILDQDSKAEETEKKEPYSRDEVEVYEPPSKKSRLGKMDESSPSIGDFSPGFNDMTLTSQHRLEIQMAQSSEQKIDISKLQFDENAETMPVPDKYGGKEKKCSSPESSKQAELFSDEIRVECDPLSPTDGGGNLPSKEKMLDNCQTHNDPLIPKSEPNVDDLPRSVVPLATIHPDPLLLLSDHSSSNGTSSCSGRDKLEVPENKEASALVKSLIDLAASPKGELKIALICNSPMQFDFRAPSLQAVLKRMEEKYLTLYRITEPGFSLSQLMKDMCECFLAEGTVSANDRQVRCIGDTPTQFLSEVSDLNVVPGTSTGHQFNIVIQSKFQNLIDVQHHIPKFQSLNGLDFLHVDKGVKVGNFLDEKTGKKGAPGCLESSTSNGMVVFERQPYFIEDLSRGAEHSKISMVNEISNELQPKFKYIPKNETFHHAYVKFLLARISNENCCSNCWGDCLSQDIPCACAGETGGEFAYTTGGLVKEKFLDSCISMNRDPQQHNLFYCLDCPLERSKDKSTSGKCKGHLVRKFIKECWYKCGCGMKCGNRVVQRGIKAKLQVFMTPEGKGWGLQTLEDLPRGAFICEYVGEIVTNTELFERNMQNMDERHTYPVLLDADWSSEGVLKDEEALCLDATSYGNVARFINHRCCDANLIEIPVEVETPDHHYYHVAFFTTREVNAFEELSWDYGIDFDDHTHPVKAFKCNCGSKFCRNTKRLKRNKSKSLILD